MTKHAATYLRRSTDRQEQSIDDQRCAIARYADQHDFTVVREYVDDAISGADTKSRKAFLQMIKDATRKGASFRYVLVYDVSRFGRTGADEAGFFRHTLTQAGIEVIYVAETLTGTDADDLLLATKQWLAHRMVVDLSKVTIRGQLSRVGKGRWCGGRPPYGYDLIYYDGKNQPYQTIRFLESGDRQVRMMDGTIQRVIPRGATLPVTSSDRANLTRGDATKVGIVKGIFDLYASRGLGIGAIAERLNDEGIPSAMGYRPGTRWKGTWSAGTIREILRNPAYRGATAWNRISYAKFHVVKAGQAVPKSKMAFGRVRRNEQADWVIVEATHEPLVSSEVFDRAQRLIGARATAYARALGSHVRKDSPYALSGLVRCARCGTRWQGYRVNKGRKRPDRPRPVTLYYCCGGYITKGNSVCRRALVGKAALEQVVVAAASKHLADIVATRGAAVMNALGQQAGSRIEGKGKIADREARASTASIVTWAARASAMLRSAADPGSTQRLLRAIVREIVLNPENATCRIAFRAIPDLENDPTIAA